MSTTPSPFLRSPKVEPKKFELGDARKRLQGHMDKLSEADGINAVTDEENATRLGEYANTQGWTSDQFNTAAHSLWGDQDDTVGGGVINPLHSGADGARNNQTMWDKKEASAEAEADLAARRENPSKWQQLQDKPFGSSRMGKRALPESFGHKLGVAARRARRLGISPNNNTLMNALIQGREQDAGIEQHDAEIAEGKAKEGFLDRTEKEDRADGQRFADQDDELDVDANVDEDEDEESNIVKAGSSRSNIKSSSRNRTFDR